MCVCVCVPWRPIKNGDPSTAPPLHTVAVASFVEPSQSRCIIIPFYFFSYFMDLAPFFSFFLPFRLDGATPASSRAGAGVAGGGGRRRRCDLTPAERSTDRIPVG